VRGGINDLIGADGDDLSADFLAQMNDNNPECLPELHEAVNSDRQIYYKLKALKPGKLPKEWVTGPGWQYIRHLIERLARVQGAACVEKFMGYDVDTTTLGKATTPNHWEIKTRQMWQGCSTVMKTQRTVEGILAGRARGYRRGSDGFRGRGGDGSRGLGYQPYQPVGLQHQHQPEIPRCRRCNSPSHKIKDCTKTPDQVYCYECFVLGTSEH